MQAKAGQTACASCPPGFYCPAGTASPLPCPRGSMSDGSSASSSPADCLCDLGYYGAGGHAPCSVCAFGTYQRDFGMSSCTQCPPGTNTTRQTHTHKYCQLIFFSSWVVHMILGRSRFSDFVCIGRGGYTRALNFQNLYRGTKVGLLGH
jgi:hypothetical protein